MPNTWILGEKFDTTYPHLASLRALWETKWQLPCKLSVYPFHDGDFSDFQPIFERLINDEVIDAYEDKYTTYFQPQAERLVQEANALCDDEGPSKEDIQKVRRERSKLYLRAACLLRIARFPSLDASGPNGIKRQVWERQKEVYLKAAALWEDPMHEVVIKHEQAGEGDGGSIPLYVRTPKTNDGGKVPVVLLLTGLDGHRPDNTGRSDEFHKRGWATVISEIPGTADCPSNRTDPTSPDRLISSILDWISSQPHFDTSRIVVWGLSAGGYYAIRAAHTHQTQLLGAIGQGAGTHHFLSREWLEKVDQHEYPFTLSHAYVKKYGYSDWEELMSRAQKEYSLVESGILKGRSCRLLLVNGLMDGLMPVEDSMLCANYGRAKDMRFYEGMQHMGYPPANECIWPWMEEVMSTERPQ